MLRLVAGKDVEAERATAMAAVMNRLPELGADELRWVAELLQQLNQRPGASSSRRVASEP